MEYQRFILSNGLRVILAPMDSVRSVTAMVMVGAGSRYEIRENNGVSHFLEHMAFKGTKKRPSALDIATLIDSIGGECNAFTSKEVTGYYIKSSSNYIELTLDILSDILQNSKLNQEEIEKERGVILEELNLYEDTPSRKITELYEELLYGDISMGWDVLGEKEVIRKINREDFLGYLSQLYSSQNTTIVVAGEIESAKVKNLIEEFFGGMIPFATLSYEKVIESQEKPQLLVKNKKTEQAHLALGVRAFPINHPDRYVAAVLAAILGGGMSSRLFHEIREKRGLAYYVRTNIEHYQDCGYLATYAGIDQKRIEEAIKVILEQYHGISSADLAEPISNEELKKAKEFIKGHLVLELEDSRVVAGFYAAQEVLEEKIETLEEVIKKIEEVKITDLERVTGGIFTNKGLNLAVIGQFDSRQRFEKLLQL